ncbi:MAG: hypothetical protein IJ060_05695 [Oscillospiraceae bacterium]|nr:hypothetical protein [Oscillospiraceae bacterium]
MQTNKPAKPGAAPAAKARSSFKIPLPKLHKPTRTDLILLILSFLAAFFIWVYIASQISPNYEVSISGVPVVVDISGSKAEGYGLSVISYENEGKLKVNCTIKGNRTVIGGLSRGDVVAYVDFDSTVTDTIGTQTLPIRLRSVNGRDFGEYKLSKSTVEVTMDQYETRSIPVNELRCPNLTYGKDVVVNADEIEYEPSMVTITGPSTQVSNIDHIRVTIDDAEELSQRKTYTSTDWELIGERDEIISDSASTFNIQATSFAVTMPVYYTKTLPVTIALDNVPANLEKSTVLKRIRLNSDFTLPGYGDDDSNLMITIETSDPANKAILDTYDSWEIGSISMYKLSIGSIFQINVEMEAGYTDRSQLGTVIVTLDATDLIADTRIIKNSDIQLINPSQDYEYALQSPAGNTIITLIGTPEELAEIYSTDLRASINLINVSGSQEGNFSQAFTVTLPDTATGVWVSPQPRVNISVSVVSADD